MVCINGNMDTQLQRSLMLLCLVRLMGVLLVGSVMVSRTRDLIVTFQIEPQLLFRIKMQLGGISGC